MKGCKSIKNIEADACQTPINKRIFSMIKRRTDARYKGQGNPNVITRVGTDRKTAGNFKGQLMRDMIRVLKEDERMVSGLNLGEHQMH